MSCRSMRMIAAKRWMAIWSPRSACPGAGAVARPRARRRSLWPAWHGAGDQPDRRLAPRPAGCLSARRARPGGGTGTWPKNTSREDWRDLPLITIDPADAKDHDDAVHAAPDDDPANEGGYVVTVAIADVAYYVRPHTLIDREARLRGNSVYFPDRVIPMLPERLVDGPVFAS
jgi:hypothetical protein